MFGLVSKKRLLKEMLSIKDSHLGVKLGQKYGKNLSEEQMIKNLYYQGIEDGADSFFNSMCVRFGLRNGGLHG